MTHHQYSTKSLTLDYLRAGVGFLLTGGPLAITDLSRTTAYILALLAVLFAVFAARTMIRQLTTVELSASGIQSIGLFRIELEWCRLERVRLRYYTTRRDRKNGWMQLSLKGLGIRRIKLDSSLEGFEDITLAAVSEARSRGIGIDATTKENLYAINASIRAPERS